MSLQESVASVPYLASPAALARADTSGRFKLPPHLSLINRTLLDVAFGKIERLQVNCPFQHGKSWLCSHYFPAWLLLLFPETRVVLAAYEEHFAATFGSKVREVISRWGGPLGIRLKKDTKAKNEWMIEGHDGGMVCKGAHGGLTGRPADLLLMDDMIKDAEEASSRAILDRRWDWFQTVAYGRLGPQAPIVNVGTRWGKLDLFGRIEEEARSTGEEWHTIKLKAIAEGDDPLGRKPGEALWPERVPLARLLKIQQARGRWFRTCWQQEPEEEEGNHFRPAGWPSYQDMGDAYAVLSHGSARRIFLKADCITLISGDWAWSTKQTADYTALGVFSLTPAGDLLTLDVVRRRLRLEELAPELAALCRRWRPGLVAVEQGHPTLERDVLRFKEIPLVRWLKPQGTDKLARALPAIIMAENGKVALPQDIPNWLDAFVGELKSFTGLADEHDDQVDCLSWACRVAATLRPDARTQEVLPEVLVLGKEGW